MRKKDGRKVRRKKRKKEKERKAPAKSVAALLNPLSGVGALVPPCSRDIKGKTSCRTPRCALAHYVVSA